MSLHRQSELVGGDTMAVVENANQRCATSFDIDIDMVRTGIQAVFQQFFDDGGGTLDDLARSDLVDERARQLSDGHDRDLELAGSSGLGRRGNDRSAAIALECEARTLGRMIEEELPHAIENGIG